MKTAFCVGLLILTSLISSCGGGSGSQTQSQSPSVSAVLISPRSASISTGAVQQFYATADLSDGSAKDVTSSVQWSSTDTNVASISSSGLAAGSTIGSVTITAQIGSVHATATLKVTGSGSGAAANLQSLTISPAAPTMPVNTSQQFTAIGKYSDGSSSDLTSLVSWSSSLKATATINASGVVSSLAAGTTTISAAFGGLTQTTILTVTAPSIVSIAVTPDGLTLGIGINQQFVATATYSDGSSSDLSGGVSWSSSDSSVATVSGSGLAATLASGSTTITATVGSVSDTTVLTVVAAHLISIAISPSDPTIALGTGVQFNAVGSFDDGSTQPLPSVTWSSSSGAVAAVNSTGFASGVSAGTTTITAASGTVSGTTSLTVSGASLVSIAVTPANSTMPVGTSKQFTATGTFSDSSVQDISASVTWTSSNPAAATINANGVVSSLASGSTTIKANFGSISGSTGLTVSTAHLVSIIISPANPRMSWHTSMHLTATGTFSDGSVGTNLAGIAWKSSKPNVASMRSTGIVHAKRGGSATISASASGITGTTTLTVGTGTLVSLAVSPAVVTASAGSMQSFAAVGTFSDGSSQDITLNTHWSSSAASVATIANGPNAAGQASCIAAGTTVIGANSGGTTGSGTLTVQ